MTRTLLVTGAAGFIGSNFVRQVLGTRPMWKVVAFDALTYAGNLRNLAGLETTGRFTFHRGNICDEPAVRALVETKPDVLINFAAETHVDRSIHGSAAFVQTNIVGTQVLLEAARRQQVPLYVQVSTDEVYGSLGPTGHFSETSPLAPNSPYSASKAGADLLARSYHVTHGVPVIITRCSNNYGPYQFPEKVIPLFVTNLLEGQPVPLYGDGLNIRDWIHVADHCDALIRVIEAGRPGEVYNIGGDHELTNLELTHAILQVLNKGESMIRRVADRAAHDRRYAVDTARIRAELQWMPKVAFDRGLRETVQWYQEHESWWREIKSGEYQDYYRRQYGQV